MIGPRLQLHEPDETGALAQKDGHSVDKLDFPIGQRIEAEGHMASKMHAAVVEQFRKPLKLLELDIPSPGAGEILVRSAACGVCHTDLHAAHGDWPVKPTLPFIPGHEAIGLVAAVGSGVKIVKEGDRVGVPWLYSACGHCEYCLTGWETVCAQAKFGGYSVNGGFAEYIIADPDYVAHVPAGLTATEAAPLVCAGITTYKGIKQTEARPGKWIAVSGAGGLGHLAIQYAKAMGLLVCAIDIDDGKLAHATRLGADFVINAKAGDPAAAVKKATGGGAHDVLITAPSLIAFKQGVGMTRKRGTCVLVGLPPGEFPVPLFDVVANCITIRGSFVGTRQDMAEALAFAVGGKVKADIELQPLSSINQIFDRLEHGDVPSRVVLDFAPAKTEKQRAEQDQQFATAGAGPARDL
jgi:propanol-preferring alcohol dehydrogenase